MTKAKPTAHEIKRAAASWVVARAHTADWTDARQSELDTWLAQSLEHTIAYWRMDAAWASTQRLAALKPHRPTPAPRPGLLPRATKAVAAVAVIALMLVAAHSALTPDQTTYATAVGDRKILTLSDGSRIELNTDTTLRVAQTAGQRRVWLDRGEAFFDIKHDAARPFIVDIGKHRVTDLGTKFVIRESAKRVDVSLLEGRARIDTPDENNRTHSAILTPGDVAVATDATLSVRKAPVRKIENELAWRTGQLVFNATTLGEAAEAFNRYNHVKVVIENPQTAALTIDGTFRASNVSAFAEVAQHVLKLTIKHSNGKITIAP